MIVCDFNGFSLSACVYPAGSPMPKVSDEVVAYEALVIGGGPAGAAAAIQLARAGHQVCLLERRQGAHDKICGEFISWEAADYLKNLGIDLPALGAQPVRHLRLYDGDVMLETPLPFPAWSLSRRRLDAALLKQTECTGAVVRRGVTVRGLSRRGNGWAIDTASKSRLSANTVFLASGKQDLRNWRRQPRQQIQDLIGLKMHLRLDEPQQVQLRQTVEIHLFDGGYAGLEPVEEGKANLCFLISKETYNASGKSWPALLAWLSNTSSPLKNRLADSVSLWSRPLAVYGTPYGYIHRPTSTMSGLFRLGDQMAVIPSFAGDGIAIALHSAFLAARVHLSGGDSELYHRQARKDFRWPLRNAQILAALFAHTQGRKVAFLLSRQWPEIMTSAICRTRLQRI
jgi:flavin-dependent dehydrogenase